ncbi:sensor histidine kinase [Bacillus sp. M6-12]|uniref:sensor histidine kinase n=1 Tax=Bacillus sp. M6-12 TaxID=2054166 RepID=UPI00215539A1|nr:sensor histidine kinase [Bacillus sp. M6-12]
MFHKLFPEREGMLPYFYLANIAIPIIFMLQEPATSKLYLGLSLIGVLLVLFRQSYWDAGRTNIYIGLMFGITLFLGFTYHPMYLYMVFIFLNLMNRLPARTLYLFCGGFAAGSILIVITSGIFTRFDYLLSILPPLIGGTILPFIVKASVGYKEMSHRLQAANETIEVLAQQAERQRIAQELHDTLGHTLSLISLKSELIERIANRNPQRVEAEAREIHNTARSALKQMRALVSDMNAMKLEEEVSHAKTLAAAAGIQLEIKWAEVPELTNLQEKIMAMSFRECMTNVVRHSRASRCEVILKNMDAALSLSVKDNGEGFDPLLLTGNHGNGISGIKERLQLVEGRLVIESSPGKGAVFTFEIPKVIRQNLEGDAV